MKQAVSSFLTPLIQPIYPDMIEMNGVRSPMKWYKELKAWGYTESHSLYNLFLWMGPTSSCAIDLWVMYIHPETKENWRCLPGWGRTYRYGPVHEYSKIVINGYAGGFAPHNVEQCLAQTFGDKWRVPIGLQEWYKTTLAEEEVEEVEEIEEIEEVGERKKESGESGESGGEVLKTTAKKKKKKKSVTTAVGGEHLCESLVAEFKGSDYQPCTCYDSVEYKWWNRFWCCGPTIRVVYMVVIWAVVPLVLFVLLVRAVFGGIYKSIL